MTQLQKINWDFVDFNSTKYPFDLNSIPWYPATFISPIPRLLVASLSKEGDTVLDPFGGKGTTAIEATLQNRVSVYCDLNPFICESTEGLFAAIEYALLNEAELSNEMEYLKGNFPKPESVLNMMEKYHISKEIERWFHKETIRQLLTIVDSIHQDDMGGKTRNVLIKKMVFSSILKFASSQQGHFTYVTDNCAPDHEKNDKGETIFKEMVCKDAFQLYADKLNQTINAAKEFVVQYRLAFPQGNLEKVLEKRQIVTGDSRDLSWIADSSIDLVVTSPPYICSQDYIKTMRLMNMFFQNKKAFEEDVNNEIGARTLRRGKGEVVVSKFYSDMCEVFSHIKRVLKQDGFFALVIGQGKAKVTSGYDVISDLIERLQNDYGFHLIFRTERQIGSRVIRIGGVDKESVLIFYK